MLVILKESSGCFCEIMHSPAYILLICRTSVDLSNCISVKLLESAIFQHVLCWPCFSKSCTRPCTTTMRRTMMRWASGKVTWSSTVSQSMRAGCLEQSNALTSVECCQPITSSVSSEGATVTPKMCCSERWPKPEMLVCADCPALWWSTRSCLTLVESASSLTLSLCISHSPSSSSHRANLHCHSLSYILMTSDIIQFYSTLRYCSVDYVLHTT